MNLHTISDHFRSFITSHPAISPDRLAIEMKMDRSNLHKIISGNRKIPAHRVGDFIQIMEKYGYTIKPIELITIEPPH